ncbi:hypothetical protein H1230_15710 [Paenibacillus sp. 19GGS1-52]|uniref:hypothetical protein n=1 Tax=Paenibacillus sp. 19GGS1-52 TaxID=2758563 RepID=UPI001EFA5967|nr:hypothetical protein [Paenibacillus sp. 19GGS1-52]ULO10084.1 hypothetical protein H1230_15710 [Paenibacillus sp. 19GGS1-52]
MRTSSIQNVYINDLSNSSLFICGSVGNIKSSYAGRKETAQSSQQQADNGARVEAVETLNARPFLVGLESECEQGEEEEFEILNSPSESIVKIEGIKVLSISSGTTFQIGNCDFIDLNSRIREIKQGMLLIHREYADFRYCNSLGRVTA